MKNVKNILGYLCGIIFVAGLTLFIPSLVAIYYKETSEAIFFLAVASVVSIIGFLVRVKFKPREATPTEAMVISALGWLIVSFIGSIPYIVIAKMSLIDSYFEAMSGFTTTGMTMISDVENLPHSLLFWRAFTQWVGGVGIILLFILFIPHSGLGIGVWRLYRAEAREERLTARIADTVRRIWLIYLFYTLLCSLLLWATGFNYFEALTHAFTTLSTGGFSTRNLSIGSFKNPYAEAIITVFMLLGATNFLVHMRIFTKKFSAAIKSIEVKTALLIVAVSSLLIAYDLSFQSSHSFLDSLRVSIFQVTSILTTTGYTTANIIDFPPLSKAILMILMIIGGGIGSTAGALKIIRIVILTKFIHTTLLRTILPPGAIKPLRLGKNVVEDDEILRVAGFFIIYVFLLAVSGFILTLHGFEPFSAFSAVFSAQGNVGPCFMPITSSLPPIPKIVLIFGMWAGRLEIIPVLVLLSPDTWKEFRRLGKRKPEA